MNIHRNPRETRERIYERAREGGTSPDAARRIAEDAARITHETVNRRDRKE